MINVGKTQMLKVKDINSKGAVLTDKDNDGEVLLSGDLLPINVEIGDELSVFVYSNELGNFTASLKKPNCEVGDIAYLKVVKFTSKGAYLDWGFAVDLFMPRDNIFYRIEEGKSYLLRIFANNENKIRATTDVYDYLRADSKYQKDDPVSGVIYKKLENGSYLVAIDNIYYGLIPDTENYRELEYGEIINGRVIRIREDGKIDVSTRKKAGIQLIDDSQLILNKMKKNNGVLKLTDRSSPHLIQKELNISKKAFKRAVGRLLKDGYIKKNENSLEKI